MFSDPGFQMPGRQSNVASAAHRAQSITNLETAEDSNKYLCIFAYVHVCMIMRLN